MLLQALLEATGRFPHKVAAQDLSRRLTYSELTTLAAALRRVVLRETQRGQVGLMLPATAACTGTLYGILWAGKTAIPLNFLLQPPELAAIVADSGIDRVISTVHFRPLLEKIPVRCLYLEELGLKRRFVFEKFRRMPDPPAINADDIAAIIYTSGTTGRPKGVCLSYGNIASNGYSAAQHLRLGPEVHLLGIIPPFHAFGLTVLNFLPALLGGGAVSFVPRFSPQATYELIGRGEINLLVAVPSMYAAMARLKHLDRSALRNVHMAISGAEPLHRPTYDCFLERTGLPLIEGYGMTEASPIISVDLPWAHRPGTVGPPLPCFDVQLRDAEGRVIAEAEAAAAAGASGRVRKGEATYPRSGEGELYIRGTSVMKGYYRRPEETVAAIDRDGWFRTGDLVRLDPDGHLVITGRVKDLIIVAGENVLPREVENVLEQHPAVAEAAVIGQPDASRGEVVVAFVSLREDAEASPENLREFCHERLAGYKTPREVHFCREFPRGPTGKILKQQLRAQLPAGA